MEEKTIVNKEAPPVIAKEVVAQENKVAATVKTATADTGKSSYPAHKTIDLRGTSQELKKEEPVKPTITNALNKPESEAGAKTVLLQGSYPSHKTHYFVKEEVTSTEQYTAPLVTPDSNENASVEPKQASLKNVAVLTKQQPVSNKKPIVWIAASAVLLLSSAGTAWYAYQQKKSMQEEISTLKQSNEVLAGNIKKLQKELHIDDIIARAGKVDAKNNIVVAADVNASEIVRACFSITPNSTAKTGKKMLYVRFLTEAGTVLTSGTANVFDYKGEKIPYSSKAEINFTGREMMLCIDYKPTEKLQKGTYKAEIYNDGVLDGTSTFELK